MGFSYLGPSPITLLLIRSQICQHIFNHLNTPRRPDTMEPNMCNKVPTLIPNTANRSLVSPYLGPSLHTIKRHLVFPCPGPNLPSSLLNITMLEAPLSMVFKVR